MGLLILPLIRGVRQRVRYIMVPVSHTVFAEKHVVILTFNYAVETAKRKPPIYAQKHLLRVGKELRFYRHSLFCRRRTTDHCIKYLHIPPVPGDAMGSMRMYRVVRDPRWKNRRVDALRSSGIATTAMSGTIIETPLPEVSIRPASAALADVRLSTRSDAT